MDDGGGALTDEPPHKKMKASVVSSTVWPQVESLKASYRQASPYPHALIRNVFDKDFLKNVLQEMKEKSSVNFKESDLFKVYQSMDLANLKDCPENRRKLPYVMQLREELYSTEWRHMIEEVIGLPADTLSGDKVDCAYNCHTTGCHLLCHDDVIGSRCVSYILYLTAEDWKEEEGGALELYPSVDSKSPQRIPATTPSTRVLPLFNHIAFFQVQPGVSFHSVQEVSGDRPRLSLQGWYHYREDSKMGNRDQKATLELLKEKNDDPDDEDENPPFARMDVGAQDATNDTKPLLDTPIPELSKADQVFLKEYIDPTYFQPDALKEIQQVFEDESSVQLQRFFAPKYHEVLLHAMKLEDAALPKGDNGGVSDDWTLVGPPHKQRFLEYQGAPDAAGSVGAILSHLRKEVLQSPAFGRWLQVLCSNRPLGQRGRVRRFRRGLDYTVAHHGLLLPEDSPPVLDATFCFVLEDDMKGKPDDSQANEKEPEGDPKEKSVQDPNTNTNKEEDDEEEEDTTWESGNVGGFECYIAADDDDKGESSGPADEYNADDDTELLSVSASHNTLSLVLRDTGTMRFVKYVGCRAPSSRWDVSMEYQLPPFEDTDKDVGESETKEESKADT